MKPICLNSIPGQKSNSRPFLYYTILFCLGAAVAFCPYLLTGKTFLVRADAYKQHYPALVYYGNYLREVLHTVFAEHSLDIPTWDLSIGWGGDIITTMHYYCLGDPLNLLSVFFAPEFTDLLYHGLIVLRLYLAGCAALTFFLHFRLQRWASILAALVYVLSGYGIGPATFHPFFAIPMIWLPLILLGVEKIFEGRSPALFIISVATSAVSNFYFFYMLVIFTVGYAIIRYLTLFRPFRFGQCVSMVWKFLGLAILGLMIAAPVFLPNVLTLLGSDRFSAEREIPLLYPLRYYMEFAGSMISDNHADYYLYVSVGCVAAVSVFGLLATPLRRHWKLKAGLIAMGTAALIPWFGSALNGFSYASNRWIWALCFFLSLITAVALPKLEQLDRKELLVMMVLAVLFCGACVLSFHIRAIASVAMIAITLLVVLHYRGGKCRQETYRFWMTAVLLISMGINGYFRAAPGQGNWVERCLKPGQAYEEYSQSIQAVAGSTEELDLGRLDTNIGSVLINAAMLYDVNGTCAYFSTPNPGTTRFQRAQMLRYATAQSYSGLDRRSYLAAALGVRAYATDGEVIPWGFSQKDSNGICWNTDPVPMVYAFDTVYPADDLTVEERQQGLLQFAMTDEVTGLPEAKPAFSNHTLECVTTFSEGIRQTEDGFVVTVPNATMTLDFDPVENCELYYILTGMTYDPPAKKGTATIIYASSGNVRNGVEYLTPYDHFYCGYQDFLLNLGYSEDQRNQVTVTFSKQGTYRFEDTRLVVQPMDDIGGFVDALQNSGISEIAMEKHRICFQSERHNAGIACVAIPWQEGWRAWIDGAETKVLQIQDGLCGILLPAGNHEIRMVYQTPYLPICWVMCVGGVAAFLFLCKKRV